ncbi:MAG: metallophosphoesterase [Labilithrix sp.]|nr:metallophosphoesterase [Labilithrix sp.]
MKPTAWLCSLFALAAAAFSTPAMGAGPISKGPWVQRVTSGSAVVRVEVEPPAPATLELGVSAAGTSLDGGNRVLESKEVKALHSFLVEGLEPATRYPITVRSHGAPKYGAITTAPRDDSGAPFRFLVYGDNRTDDAAHAAVVRAMVSSASDFLVHTGDFVSDGGSASQWQTFFDIEAPLTRERCIFSSVGNHEIVDGAGIHYLRYFGPTDPSTLPDGGAKAVTPEQLNGTFRWSNARFFLVNGMVDYRTGPSRDWLASALTASDGEAGLVWRIVVVHHGLWSSGPHGENQLLHDAGIPALLRAHKVDVVLSGHDHIYERGAADGIPYIVSGGGGAPTYKVKKPREYSRRFESVRHFVEASASTAAIQFVATRPDSSVIERCALRKSAGWDCDGETSLVASASASGAAPSSSSSSAPGPAPSRCACRTVGAASTSIGAGLGGLAGVVLLLARRRRSMRH